MSKIKGMNKNQPTKLIRVGRHILEKPINIAFAVSACLLLAFTAALAIASSRPDSEAMTFSVAVLSEDSGTVAIYLEDNKPNENYETSIIPTQDGSISSVVSNVRVVATDLYGYELFINTTSAGGNMKGANNSANIITPTAGSIDNPAPFTASNCNTWGFSTPSVDGNFSAAFDTSYGVLSNINTTDTANGGGSKYAAIPTDITPIHSNAGDTITTMDESRPYYFATCATPTISPDEYQANITWTALPITSPVLPPAQNGDIMQTITNETCPLERTWVVDARDNHTYWIQKIPNSGAGGADLCWMETNLAYAGDTSNGGTDQYNDTMGLQLFGTGGMSGGLGYTGSGYTIPTPPTDGSSFTTAPTPPSTATGGDNGAQYGYFYNWCAAMGGQSNACNNTSTTGFDTSVSICPAGWRLPVGNAANDPAVNDFSALNNIVNGGATNTDAGLRNDWLGVYAGGLNTSGKFGNVGTYGYYWSSTVYDATNARNLDFNSGGVNPANSNGMAYGFAVRCVQ